FSVTRVAEFAAGIGVAHLAIEGLRRGMDAVKEAIAGTFETNASLETAQLQFKILMGSADKAQEHVRELFEFAKATPFEAGPIIQASRQLEVMGGAALNTKANLTLIGDAAAGVSAPIQEVANWVGR